MDSQTTLVRGWLKLTLEWETTSDSVTASLYLDNSAGLLMLSSVSDHEDNYLSINGQQFYYTSPTLGEGDLGKHLLTTQTVSGLSGSVELKGSFMSIDLHDGTGSSTTYTPTGVITVSATTSLNVPVVGEYLSGTTTFTDIQTGGCLSCDVEWSYNGSKLSYVYYVWRKDFTGGTDITWSVSNNGSVVDSGTVATYADRVQVSSGSASITVDSDGIMTSSLGPFSANFSTADYDPRSFSKNLTGIQVVGEGSGGGGGGDVGSGSVSYPVNITNGENVDITINGDPVTNGGTLLADVGQYIVISAQPHTGYTIIYLTVNGTTLSQEGGYSIKSADTEINIIVTTSSSTYTLTLTQDDGIESVSGDGSYATGESVICTAVVKDGYEFYGWRNVTDGVFASSDNPYEFEMFGQDTTLRAESSLIGATNESIVYYNDNGNSVACMVLYHAGDNAGSMVTVYRNVGGVAVQC